MDKQQNTSDIRNPISHIRLLILDVDGILTDGSIQIDDRGVETKRFHVRDGLAIKAAMGQGIEVAVLTARSSRAVTLRLREIGVNLYIQGARDKLAGLEHLVELTGIDLREAAYMGDDLQDLPAMLRCGYKMTVADAATEVRGVADYITHKQGGQGAVREAIEHILHAQGKWAAVLEKFGL